MHFYFSLSCRYLQFLGWFHWNFFCASMYCLMNTEYIDKGLWESWRCFKMEIMEINDVWNATAVLITQPPEETNQITAAIHLLIIMGLRSRLSWKVNYIQNIIWHTDFPERMESLTHRKLVNFAQLCCKLCLTKFKKSDILSLKCK